MSITSSTSRRTGAAALSLTLLLAPSAARAQLSLVSAPPVSLEVSPATVSVIVGQRNTLYVLGRTATGTSFVPSADAAFAVDVSDRGVLSAPATVTLLRGQSSVSVPLTGMSAGRTAVTLRYAGLAATTQVTVTNVDGTTTSPATPAVISLAPTSATVQVGSRLALSSTERSTTGTVILGRTLAWRSTSPAVATVSSAGVVTAIAPGAASVVVSDGTLSASATVTVPVPSTASSPSTTPVSAVASVVLQPADEVTLAPGLPLRVRASTLDASGQPLTGRLVSWSSSNAASVRVASDGTVVGVGGSATITAECEGKRAALVVTVTRLANATQ